MYYFVIRTDEENGISTFNGEDVKIYNGNVDSIYAERIFRKTNNVIHNKPIDDDSDLHYFDVIIENNAIKLCVYKATFDKQLLFKQIYQANITKGEFGIIENGECDLEFWHEFFAGNMATEKYNEKIVNTFCISNNPMKIIRKLFPLQMQENPFIFFEKYKKNKKLNNKTFDIKLFHNIPKKQLCKTVGKDLDNKEGDDVWRHYVWTSEIEIDGEVFIDADVISGPVADGKMEVKKRNRFFITEGFVYSPDGGDPGIFASTELHGIMHCQKLNKKHPTLMLDRYKGKFPFIYLFSREGIPAFEILAKAGYTKYADKFIEEYSQYDLWVKNNRYYTREGARTRNYYKPTIEFPYINYNVYGKNDKEIFGFKLSKFAKLSNDIIESQAKVRGYNIIYHFSDFVRDVGNICNYNPSALNEGLDEFLFNHIKNMGHNKNLGKELSYLKSIGTSNAKLYEDYVAMCKRTDKWSGGVYPLNLKHEHDVMITYINQLKEAEKALGFTKTVKTDEYLKYLWDDENEKYCILAPRVADDLVKESYQLSHCVRSYIDRVASGGTKIYFMRNKDKKATPFITIEVTYNGRITQTRGKGNRNPTPDEANFIYRWAREKGLYYDVY